MLCVHSVVVVVAVGTPRAHLVEFMLPARTWICGQELLPGHVTQKEAPLNAGRHFLNHRHNFHLFSVNVWFLTCMNSQHFHIVPDVSQLFHNIMLKNLVIRDETGYFFGCKNMGLKNSFAGGDNPFRMHGTVLRYALYKKNNFCFYHNFDGKLLFV